MHALAVWPVLTSSLPLLLPSLPPFSLSIQAEDGLTVKHREGSLEVIPAWGPGGKEGGRGVEKVVLFVRKGGLTVAEPFGEEGGREGGRERGGKGKREGVRENKYARAYQVRCSCTSNFPSYAYSLPCFPPCLPASLSPFLPPVLSSLPNLLPPSNTYVLVDFEGGANTAANPTLAAFSWAMGTYK